ncbi:MAG TPA: Ig-like domain-containing protein [Verrucomicrobiae bacterium]
MGVVLGGHSVSVFGANATVSTSGFTFVPPAVTINAGESVTWNNLSSGGHTTTSATSLWSSSTDGFKFVFANAGTYNYFCIPHQSLGMTGKVTVNAVTPPNVPPTVTITNPASGITLSAPASLTLKAMAGDSDGSITNVQFLQGATSLGKATTPPFSFAVNNLSAATYTFSAVASDNGGLTATNSITVHVINASPVTVGATQFASANHFQFSYSADVGLTYLVQVSTNLLDWTPINTNTATVNPTVFTDANAGRSGAYYRVGRLANP